MSGADLTEWMRRHDVRGTELAAVLGVERGTVYRWKRRGNAPAYLPLALESLERRMRRGLVVRQ